MTKKRNSSIELLRIITMFMIVAHHAVWNSGVVGTFDYDRISASMQFLQCWGAFGKTGINVFVLISAYFMCTSSLTLKRIMKVFVEAKFYAIICYIALFMAGYEVVSCKRLFLLGFCYIRDINVGFTGTFIALYLLIPFLNLLIKSVTKNQLLYLVSILILIYTGNTMLFFHSGVYSELGWYVTLYFIGAYMRLYPFEWMHSKKITGFILLGTLLFACSSILMIDCLGLFKYISPYYFTNNCQHCCSLAVAIFALLWFKNIDIGNIPLINKIASCTFGVFLIHISSDAMRTWLWGDLFKMLDHCVGSIIDVAFYFFLVNIAIFSAGTIIDICRQYLFSVVASCYYKK